MACAASLVGARCHAASGWDVSLIAMREHALQLIGIASVAFAVACGGSSPAGEPGEAGERSKAEGPSDTGNPAPSTGTTEPTKPAPASRPAYLAIGDSIAFGYNLNERTYFADGTSKDVPTQTENAIGYPEALEKILARDFKTKLPVANTSCPGEASGSLVTGKLEDDNNCFENRHEFPLHYEYDHQDNASGSGVSQLAHALKYISADPGHVKLLTITIGANDVLKYAGATCTASAASSWAQSLADKACLAAGAVDAVLNKIQSNWETILGSIALSGYKGPVVAVLYYSTGYKLADLPTRTGIKLINAKIHDAAKVALAKHPALNLKFVESYDVFETVAKSHDGDACAAGLTMMMTKGPAAGTCDAHASNMGEEKIAQAVWSALSLSEQAALLKSGTKL